MEIGIFGLGKMGLNLALNLQKYGFSVFGYDVSEISRKKAIMSGINVEETIDRLLETLRSKKIILLSLPAGEITNNLVKELCDVLLPDDVIVDCGNSFYKDSLKNYEYAKTNGIKFLDCGTSGGMEGALDGACLMIGGDKDIFDETKEIFQALACDEGYLYAGRSGSGHYLKMIHNGIEYGMMQAIGEGFDILQACEYDFELEDIAAVWNHGSVIRSWLMELAQQGFAGDPNLSGIKGIVNASGEAKWTIGEALELEIPVPVISSSLFVRNATKIEESFSAKVVATLRSGFGGHMVVKK